MEGHISVVHQLTLVLVMGQEWLLEQAFLIRTWNLCSFTQQVSDLNLLDWQAVTDKLYTLQTYCKKRGVFVIVCNFCQMVCM
jgi:hypothetical protein